MAPVLEARHATAESAAGEKLQISPTRCIPILSSTLPTELNSTISAVRASVRVVSDRLDIAPSGRVRPGLHLCVLAAAGPHFEKVDRFLRKPLPVVRVPQR